MKPSLLALIPVAADSRVLLDEHFDVCVATTADLLKEALATKAADFKAVLTNGATGVSTDTIDQLPSLTLIAALGVGYENIPLEHARKRGIALANGAGTNAPCVADHAFALLLAAVRDIAVLDGKAREGIWREGLPMHPNVSGKRMGILGLGSIGLMIARRASGFDMEIGYHNRKPRPDTELRYFDSLMGMAEWADYLIVVTPGGEGTKHLINKSVLETLGPRGYLVNVARGSVVDTEALVQALHAGTIAGAGLDVYEGEPSMPASLAAAPRCVLTPHVAGRSPEAIEATIINFIENAKRHFAGQPLVTPI